MMMRGIFLLTIPLLLLSACGDDSVVGENGTEITPSERQLKTFSQGATGFYYNPPTLVHSSIYIGTSHKLFRDPAANNFFFKLDSNLNKIWEYSLDEKEVRGGGTLDSAGNVYFVVEDGRLNGDTSNSKLYLYSLSNNGAFRWSRLISSSVPGTGMSNPAISSDDTIYVGEDKFYAFAVSGTEVWSYGNDMVIMNAPAIDSDGNIYFSSSSAIVSLSKTGAERWSLATSGEFFSSPAFSTDRSRVFVAVENKLFCLESSTGNELWEFTPPGMSGWFRASPAVDDQNNIYIGTKSDGQSVFYAIKADGSETLWKNEIGADLYSSPALGTDNAVYVGSERADGGIRLHALDMSTGATRWSASLAGDVTWSSPAIANDGTLYIATMACGECENGHVYSFDTDSAGLLANAGSPRFHGGNSNTGR